MTSGDDPYKVPRCDRCQKPVPPVFMKDGLCTGCRTQVRAAEAPAVPAALPPDEQGAAPPPPPPSDPEAAKREMARRQLARNRLIPFVKAFLPNYKAGWFHLDLAQRLEQFYRDVEAGLSPRLAIFVPPRHGKTELTSKKATAWALGKHPEWEFIVCSYSSTLADRISRDVRSTMREPYYRALFPHVAMNPEVQAVELWETTAGGGILAAGVGGPITGSGAKVLLIDDPVKNREEADSATSRQAKFDWYTSTAYTRLAPGGGILVIQTRWHEDDFAGRLIAAMENDEGDVFEVVDYPAIALEDEKYRKKGEPLHPERYDLDALHRIKKVLPDRDWWALYQQRPIPDGGAFFTRDMFDFYMPEELPSELNNYSAWDLAVGEREVNDYTVGLTAGMDDDSNLWLRDRFKARVGGLKIVEALLDNHVKWNEVVSGVEKGQIQMAIAPFLDRMIAERRQWGFYYMPLNPGRRDKVARARPIQAMCQHGKVKIPHPSTAPWVEDFLESLLRFPHGTFDDDVDAFAWLGQMLTDMSVVHRKPPPKKKSWKDGLDKYIGEDLTNTTKGFMSA